MPDPVPEITVPSTTEECNEELALLQSQANVAQETILDLQRQIASMNQRAILLQGAIAAYATLD